MRTALRFLTSFVLAYAPALAAMLALPALGRAGLGPTGFVLLSGYLFLGAPWAWLRLDRRLAQRAARTHSRQRAARWRSWPPVGFPADPNATPIAWETRATPNDPNPHRDAEPERDAYAAGDDAAQGDRRRPDDRRRPGSPGGAAAPQTGWRALFTRIEGRTILSLAVLYVIAAEVLSPALAVALFLITGACAGLALISMVADVQTLRRRGRLAPDRQLLPAYALCIGAFLASTLLALWCLIALRLQT